MPATSGQSERPPRTVGSAGGVLSEAAGIFQLGTPNDEFRRLVQARMETLAKLDDAGVAPTAAEPPASGGRLELYAEALVLGLQALEEGRA